MQEVIVGAIVAYAACAVVVRYLPARLKAQLGMVLARCCRYLGWSAAASKLEAGQGSRGCGGGCGSCGGCGSRGPSS